MGRFMESVCGDLSPSLSRLLRRGEKEKALRRSGSLHFVVYPADCAVMPWSRRTENQLGASILDFPCKSSTLAPWFSD